MKKTSIVRDVIEGEDWMVRVFEIAADDECTGGTADVSYAMTTYASSYDFSSNAEPGESVRLERCDFERIYDLCCRTAKRRHKP